MKFIHQNNTLIMLVLTLCSIFAMNSAMSLESTPVKERGLNLDKNREIQTLTFGIVPQQSASQLAKLWIPILNYLSKKTGYKFQFKTAKNIPIFEKRVSQGEYDIAYMNPYHYTVYHDAPGYEAIAKAKNKRIKGIIVVPKDSNYSNLEELDGHKLAFPSPAAFAASILTRSEFTRRGIKFEEKYVSSHDSVYRNVASGRMSAGGGVIRTFKNIAPEVNNKLRILWITPGYTPHAIAVNPRIPTQVRKHIQQAMVDMDKDKEGKVLLKSIKIKGLEEAHNSDWDDVRKLDIKLLK